MEIRQARPEDAAAVREVVARSAQASYAISPGEIDTLLSAAFDEGRLETAFEAATAADERHLVAVETGESTDPGDDAVEGQVVGYAEGRTEDGGVIRWLHVDPGDRGEGAGTALFEAMTEALGDGEPQSVRAHLHAENVEGGTFFERQGMVPVDDGRADLEAADYPIRVYAFESAADAADVQRDRPAAANDAVEGAEVDPAAIPDRVETPAGTFLVSQEETLSGSKGPFLLLYETTDPDHEELYGYYCDACDTLVEAMDSLGRLLCPDCGNLHRPDDWDASYL